jgi:hypothetical protein
MTPMVEGWQGSGYRTRTAFRSYGASLNPARALLHVLFYWKGDLVPRFHREQDFQHHGAETPRYLCRLAATTPIPCGWRERDAESTLVSDQPARFSPDHVLPRDFRSYRKGNSCSCSVASNIIGQLGSVQQLPTPLAVAVVAMHPRRTQGRDAESTNFGSLSFLSRSHAATIALIGLDTPRSFSRREGTIDAMITVAPGHQRRPFGQPRQPREAGGEGLRTHLPVDSRQAFMSTVELALDYLHIERWTVDMPCFSARSSNSPRFLRPR